MLKYLSYADEDKSVEEIQAMGFAEDEIRRHFLAWNILSRAIKGRADKDILRRVTSPTAAWRILVGSYSATTLGVKLQRMKALTNRRVKPGSNPTHTISEMTDDASDLRANRIDISDEIVCLLFANHGHHRPFRKGCESDWSQVSHVCS